VILLTGATGYLGTLVLARLLEADGPDVLCPVRARDEVHARERVDATLHGLWRTPPAGARVRVRELACDLRSPTIPARELARVTHVLHCAAAVAFDQPLGDARAINVEGTRAVLDLAARAPRLERVVHVSTAYVAGTATGVFGEDDLDAGQGFRNTYEQTKFEAERLAAARAELLPLAVARPSIVVGEAASGWTTSFNVLYPLLRAYARGLLREVPADGEAVVDVVTGDFVADALLALLLEVPDAQGAYNLTAREHALTVSTLRDFAADAFGLPPVALTSPNRGAPTLGGPLAGYLDVRCRFDARRAEAALDPLGIRPPGLQDVFPALAAYAASSSWGKRPLVREDALLAAAA
jgi:thioester reductase-like protein